MKNQEYLGKLNIDTNKAGNLNQVLEVIGEYEKLYKDISSEEDEIKRTTLSEFQAKARELLDVAEQIRERKNPVYALDNEDSDYHQNFRFISDVVGITPLQVWAVYALKHVTSIMTYVKNSDVEQPEDLDGRFADLINYTLMGFSLYREEVDHE